MTNELKSSYSSNLLLEPSLVLPRTSLSRPVDESNCFFRSIYTRSTEVFDHDLGVRHKSSALRKNYLNISLGHTVHFINLHWRIFLDSPAEFMAANKRKGVNFLWIVILARTSNIEAFTRAKPSGKLAKKPNIEDMISFWRHQSCFGRTRWFLAQIITHKSVNIVAGHSDHLCRRWSE